MPQLQNQRTEVFNIEPNLAQVQNCDLKILHNGKHQFNFQHFELLPTEIFNVGQSIANATFINWKTRLTLAELFTHSFNHWD